MESKKKAAESDVAGGAEEAEIEKFFELLRSFRDARNRLRDRWPIKATSDSFECSNDDDDDDEDRSKKRKIGSEESKEQSDPNKRHVDDGRLNLNLTL